MDTRNPDSAQATSKFVRQLFRPQRRTAPAPVTAVPGKPAHPQQNPAHGSQSFLHREHHSQAAGTEVICRQPTSRINVFERISTLH